MNLGRWGEIKASEYLEEKGYELVESNYRTEYGEIDVIALKDGELIFVEVKTRTGKKFGNPEESITPQKMDHMVSSASAYLQDHPDVQRDWRIDVIAIQTGDNRENPQINHFENASHG